MYVSKGCEAPPYFVRLTASDQTCSSTRHRVYAIGAQVQKIYAGTPDNCNESVILSQYDAYAMGDEVPLSNFVAATRKVTD